MGWGLATPLPAIGTGAHSVTNTTQSVLQTLNRLQEPPRVGVQSLRLDNTEPSWL